MLYKAKEWALTIYCLAFITLFKLPWVLVTELLGIDRFSRELRAARKPPQA